MNKWIKVCSTHEIENKKLLRFDYNDKKITYRKSKFYYLCS